VPKRDKGIANTTKRAVKEQMISRFQLIIPTHNAGIVIHEDFFSFATWLLYLDDYE
jgi:hypothetical protein